MYRPDQLEIIKQLGQFTCIAAHRRWGKTWMEILHIFLSALNLKRMNPRYMYLTPTRIQAKTNIWDEYVKPMVKFFPNYEISETELEVSFDPNDGYGVRKILLRGADDMGKGLKGAYLDGLVMDEMREHHQQTFSESLMPMLLDRNGWAIFTGTVGLGHWFDFFHRAKEDTSGVWKTFLISVEDTKALTPQQIKLAKATMSNNDFEREMMCNWYAVDTGAVFSNSLVALEQNKCISGDLQIANNAPIVTSWDLGSSDLTAVWFLQLVNGEYRAIDYFEVNRATADEKLGLKSNTESLDIRIFKHIMRKPYNYGVHILPHDSVYNVASAETSTFKKFQQMSGGAKVIVAPKLQIKSGVEALSNLLTQFKFNKDTCREGLAALHSYIPPYSTDYTHANKPFSHAADALRTFAVALPHLQTTYSNYTGFRKKTELPKKLTSKYTLT